MDLYYRKRFELNRIETLDTLKEIKKDPIVFPQRKSFILRKLVSLAALDLFVSRPLLELNSRLMVPISRGELLN